MSKKIQSWRVPPKTKEGYSDRMPASEAFKFLGIPQAEIDEVLGKNKK